MPCYENHGKAKQSDAPPEPAVIVQRMRQHNLLMHGIDSPLLDWSCARCEELEGEYSASVRYHHERLSREMAEGNAAA